MEDQQNRTNRKWWKTPLIIIAILAVLAGTAYFAIPRSEAYLARKRAEQQAAAFGQAADAAEQAEGAGEPASPQTETGQTAEPAEQAAETGQAAPENGSAASLAAQFDLSEVPAYDGKPYVEIHGNLPYFTEDEITDRSFETYDPLDELGRCTCAFACVGQDLMPQGKRASITSVHPSGWQIAKYNGIDGNYLYNRCHLIAYGLTAENANERNLITGTRYMNTLGMNDLENWIISYIRNTGHHVMYRVTPIFEGDELIARGVVMEAQSVEDDAVVFCVYAYNVQPGITIDYMTGDSEGEPFTGSETADNGGGAPGSGTAADGSGSAADEGFGTDGGSGTNSGSGKSGSAHQEILPPPAPDVTYVVNTRSKKFHDPDCDSVPEIRRGNRWDYKGTREELIEQGYEPCGSCKP